MCPSPSCVYIKSLHFEPAIIDCGDGDILLYDGTTLSTEHSNGTVLVCYDNEYGTVCDDFWDTLDAMVVCRFLGFESAGKQVGILCGLIH